MYQFFLRVYAAVFVCLILSSCTDSNKKVSDDSKKLPAEGSGVLPQIFILRDQNLSLEKQWMEPSENSFSPNFPAHVSYKNLKTLEEAKEEIQILNGREVDFLLLGQGLPQKAFLEAKLPNHKKRQIFSIFWDEEEGLKLQGRTTVLDFSKTEFKNWLAELCRQNFVANKCRVVPKSLFEDFENLNGNFEVYFNSMGNTEGLGLQSLFALKVLVDWEEFFRSRLLGKSSSESFQESPSLKSQKIGVSSPFVQVQEGPVLEKWKSENRDQMKSFLRSQTLKYFESQNSSKEGTSDSLIRAIDKKNPEAK